MEYTDHVLTVLSQLQLINHVTHNINMSVVGLFFYYTSHNIFSNTLISRVICNVKQQPLPPPPPPPPPTFLFVLSRMFYVFPPDVINVELFQNRQYILSKT